MSGPPVRRSLNPRYAVCQMHGMRYLLSVILCCTASAQTPGILSTTEAEYSAEVRAARLQGSVIVSGTLAEDGTLRNSGIRRPLGPGLDERALEAVTHLRFEPGLSGAADVRVTFRLPLELRSWHLDRVVFDTPANATRPVLLKAQFAPSATRTAKRPVAVSFDITEQGVPANIQAAEGSDPAAADEVIALIREWRFQASLKNGMPVPARGYLDFSQVDADPESNGLVASERRPTVARPRKKF
jgi:TonB family protein